MVESGTSSLGYLLLELFHLLLGLGHLLGDVAHPPITSCTYNRGRCDEVRVTKVEEKRREGGREKTMVKRDEVRLEEREGEKQGGSITGGVEVEEDEYAKEDKKRKEQVLSKISIPLSLHLYLILIFIFPFNVNQPYLPDPGPFFNFATLAVSNSE